MSVGLGVLIVSLIQSCKRSEEKKTKRKRKRNFYLSLLSILSRYTSIPLFPLPVVPLLAYSCPFLSIPPHPCVASPFVSCFPMSTPSDHIIVNAGGRLFETTETTLLSSGSRFFQALLGPTGQALLAGRRKHSPNIKTGAEEIHRWDDHEVDRPTNANKNDRRENGNNMVFVDRDSDLFADVLFFMRSHRLPASTRRNELRLEDIQAEADFFVYDDLWSSCQEALTTLRQNQPTAQSYLLQVQATTSTLSSTPATTRRTDTTLQQESISIHVPHGQIVSIVAITAIYKRQFSSMDQYQQNQLQQRQQQVTTSIVLPPDDGVAHYRQSYSHHATAADEISSIPTKLFVLVDDSPFLLASTISSPSTMTNLPQYHNDYQMAPTAPYTLPTSTYHSLPLTFSSPTDQRICFLARFDKESENEIVNQGDENDQESHQPAVEFQILYWMGHASAIPGHLLYQPQFTPSHSR